MKAKKKYYAVAVGRKPGIYTEWYGKGGAEVQIRGFSKARYRSFKVKKDAELWLETFAENGGNAKAETEAPAGEFRSEPKKDGVIIYTDGGCRHNPGPGGYGAVLKYGKQRRELSGGFRLTTNNRMELLACIEGLKCLKHPCGVVLHSDSKYVVNGITKGWAKRWRANGWMRNKQEKAVNPDLWAALLDLCEIHDVEFVWVKGHAGIAENERCDQLAGLAMSQPGLAPDTVYEKGS